MQVGAWIRGSCRGCRLLEHESGWPAKGGPSQQLTYNVGWFVTRGRWDDYDWLTEVFDASGVRAEIVSLQLIIPFPYVAGRARQTILDDNTSIKIIHASKQCSKRSSPYGRLYRSAAQGGVHDPDGGTKEAISAVLIRSELQ